MSEEQQGDRPQRRRRSRRRSGGSNVTAQTQGHVESDQPAQGQLEAGHEDARPNRPERTEQRNPNQRRSHPHQEQRSGDQSRYSNQRNDRRTRADQLVSSSISVIIPLLNEAESLPELSKQLESVLERISRGRYEVLFIDDGSTDDSFRVIEDIHTRNNRFKAIRFRTNHGKSAALAIGFAESKGDIVITMDADLQDDPAEIPAMIAKLEEGYDLVSGWKRKRHDPWHKTIPSKLTTRSLQG